MQELPNKIVSEIFGRAIGLLRPTIWLMAAASVAPQLGGRTRAVTEVEFQGTLAGGEGGR